MIMTAGFAAQYAPAALEHILYITYFSYTFWDTKQRPFLIFPRHRTLSETVLGLVLIRQAITINNTEYLIASGNKEQSQIKEGPLAHFLANVVLSILE
jgi:hypothetical protein